MRVAWAAPERLREESCGSAGEGVPGVTGPLPVLTGRFERTLRLYEPLHHSPIQPLELLVNFGECAPDGRWPYRANIRRAVRTELFPRVARKFFVRVKVVVSERRDS